MTRPAVFVLATVSLGLLPGSASSQAKRYPLESTTGLRAHNVVIDPVTFKNRRGLRVTVAPAVAGQPEAELLALIDGLEFSSGVIEAEIAGAPAPGAGAGARGFVGIAFRLQPDLKTYDAFYLRPTNGRADDQLRRNHSTQYVSEPEFPWHRLRKEHPGVYESYVDLETGAWTRVRIVVDGRKAQLFVHGAAQPALIVNDLKLGDVAGGVGLWIGVGTEAYFSSVKVTGQ